MSNIIKLQTAKDITIEANFNEPFSTIQDSEVELKDIVSIVYPKETPSNHLKVLIAQVESVKLVVSGFKPMLKESSVFNWIKSTSRDTDKGTKFLKLSYWEAKGAKDTSELNDEATNNLMQEVATLARNAMKLDVKLKEAGLLHNEGELSVYCKGKDKK